MFQKVLEKMMGKRSQSGMLNIRFELQRMATQSTAQYVHDHINYVSSVDNRNAVHDVALAEISIEGLVLEFGVFSGQTVNYIAAKLPQTVVDGFDSFEGLPEFWRDGYDRGHFASELPKVLPNVRLHKGWFHESLPRFFNEDGVRATIPLAYLHVDCDLYSSTVTIFEHLSKNIQIGTVIVFDEYLNYPGWQQGEFLAFQEFVKKRRLNYRYLTYNHLHEQVAVKITA
jgi:hypothetical protein